VRTTVILEQAEAHAKRRETEMEKSYTVKCYICGTGFWDFLTWICDMGTMDNGLKPFLMHHCGGGDCEQ